MKTARLLVFLLIVGGLGFLTDFLWARDVPEEAKADFQQALELREAGDWRGAEALFRKALTFDPGNTQVHFELANLYVSAYDSAERSGKPSAHLILQKARRELETCAMFDVDFIPAQYNLGVICRRMGDYEKAREIFRSLVKKVPNRVPILLQIAGTYEDQEFFDEARDYYIQAGELEPENTNIQWSLKQLSDKKEASVGREKMEAINRLNQIARQGGALDSMGQNEDSGAGSLMPYAGSLLMQKLFQQRSSERGE